MKLKPVLLLAAMVSLIGVNGASASSRHHEHFARHDTAPTTFAEHRSATRREAGSRFTSRRVAGYTVPASSYAAYGYAPQETSQQVADTSLSRRHASGGRPSAWCGWEMRQLVGSDPGPQYNLARNWAHWGHSVSGPAPGVVGVMAHHVFKVVSVLGNGTVMAISGNDGHAVRTRPRSTAGVIAWRGA